MFGFNYYNPANLIFEVGGIAKAGEVTCRFGKRALLVVGEASMDNLGHTETIRGSLAEAGIDVETFAGVSPNPTEELVNKIADRFRSESPDVIVAVGGGSVMDTAKACSLALTHEGSFTDYRVTGSKSVPGIQNKLIPVVTIPTTAGTGSEISPAALITIDQRKEVFFSPYMFPKAAVVDPELAVSLPADLTAQIGIDAFTQSMEAFVSIGAQPFSDMFASESMTLVVNNLRQLVSDLSNLELRANMALAGTLSCYAIGQAGVGAVHALSDPLSGRYNIGHGRALSLLIVEVMRANLSANLPKFAKLAAIMGVDTAGMTEEVAASKAVKAVGRLVADLDLKGRLRDFGVERELLQTMALESDNPDMSTNPKKLSVDEIVSIYEAVM